MKRIICDKCRKEIIFPQLPLEVTIYAYFTQDKKSEYGKIDLCQSCCDWLLDSVVMEEDYTDE